MGLPTFLIKKSDNEGIDYYYLGDVLPVKDAIEDTTMPDEGGQLNVVKFVFEFYRVQMSCIIIW